MGLYAGWVAAEFLIDPATSSVAADVVVVSAGTVAWQLLVLAATVAVLVAGRGVTVHGTTGTWALLAIVVIGVGAATATVAAVSTAAALALVAVAVTVAAQRGDRRRAGTS
ncbi:MAG: hypothetical protein WB441_04505 [Nocardioidaceae bacterium]